MKLIAFPSIGTGNHGYSNDVVARIMIKEVYDYLSANKKSCIDRVYLVIFVQDTFDAFRKEIANYSSPALAQNSQKRERASLYSNSPPARAPSEASQDSKSFSINNVTVNIVRGDITASSRDVIVNPTDSTISLSGQGVAGAILQKGGDELKQLCHVLTSNGKILDDSTLVLETKATGALKSKSIFHISFEGKNFNKIIVECLQKADTTGYSSIAFPAIGTGVKRYPDDEAATGMLTAIHQSSKQLHRLKTIDIVLYQASVFEVFAQVFENPSTVLETGFIKRAKNATLRLFGLSASAGKSDVVPLLQGPQHDKLSVLIYAETVEHAESAEKKFYNFVDEIFLNDVIDDPLISDLTAEDELAIRESAEHVEIIIDRHPLNRIQLHGETTKVQDVKCAIVKKLSEMAQKASIQREASQLNKIIKWRRMTPNGPEEYDEVTTYKIEQAYLDNPSSKYTQGDPQSQVHFTISFKEMSEKDHGSGTNSKVVREDIMKKGECNQ